MNPLALVEAAVSQGTLPAKVMSRLSKRAKLLREGVERVEKSTGFNYPNHFVNPCLWVAEGAGELAFLYARTLPVEVGDGVQIVVELSAPLLLHAPKGTLHAVLAHEFLHYSDLVLRFSRLQLLSDTSSPYIFEAPYEDLGRALEPKQLIKDRGLLRMMANRFRPSLLDTQLDKRTTNQWLRKGLPTTRLNLEANIARVKVERILRTSFDPRLVERLKGLGSQRSP